jgi:hypothetical protein
MAYVRKTVDEFRLLVHYGQGWEHELTEESHKEARARRTEYRDNCPQYPCKIEKKRVKKESSE